MKTENGGGVRRRSLVLITASGCLAMAFVAGTTNPAFVEFMRALGARDLHFGLLGGIPMVMLSMQFLGAVVTNVVDRRKPLFMVLCILGRFLYIPLVCLPLLFPPLRSLAGVWVIILLLAAIQALVNVSGPLWLSWMADLIPRRVLNTYWGRRQRWMYLSWTATFLSVAAFMSLVHPPIMVGFPVVASVAALLGVADIILFTWVHEPPNAVMRGEPILHTLLAPLTSTEFRPFVVFSCAWMAVAFFAAAFMQVYALEVLGLSVWKTTMVRCASGVGIALVSSTWGRMADRHGHRPILAICIGMKSLIVIAFLLVTPRWAVWVLAPALFVDSFWNAGAMVASNGYLLKAAPQQNRSMFIASITGLAGICGGLGAIAGGAFLRATSGFSMTLLGREWTHYHLLFAVSIPLRWVCIALAFRIREPKSTGTSQFLYLLRGAWPMRFILFPVGLYRRVGERRASVGAG